MSYKEWEHQRGAKVWRELQNVPHPDALVERLIEAAYWRGFGDGKRIKNPFTPNAYGAVFERLGIG